MKKLFILNILLCSFISQPRQSIITTDYVPNKETAIKIAEILWLPVYGHEIYNNTPFVAELKDGKVWVVRGSVQKGLGGYPYIEIQKSDCKVLKMTHTK